MFEVLAEESAGSGGSCFHHIKLYIVFSPLLVTTAQVCVAHSLLMSMLKLMFLIMTGI